MTDEHRIKALSDELEHLRFMWMLCAEGVRQLYYLGVSADCQRAGREAFERMRLRAEDIKAEINRLSNKEEEHGQ
jgi:hypothetical protein